MVGDVPMKAGLVVGSMVMANHFNEKYYKNPLEFKPERWETECNETHPFVHIGFSAGPRSCFGKSLAFLESKIFLVKLLKRYHKIEVPRDRVIRMNYVFNQPYPVTTKFTKASA